MGDFFKIFFGLCLLVGAFFVGKNYGENTYKESEEFKKITLVREELDFAKNDLENAKAKLQNIVDRADNEKTDELLAQILQVFLADLGLQIQNRELILKNAKANIKTDRTNTEISPQPLKLDKPSDANPETNLTAKANRAINKLNREEVEKQKNINKFKSNEWLLLNSNNKSEVQKNLDKLVIKNLKSFVDASQIEAQDCINYLGEYRGKIKNELKQNMGSMSFNLKNNQEENKFFGNISWFNNPNPTLKQDFDNSCGKKLQGFSGRFFSLTENRYIQVYRLQDLKTLAGNFYEILPAGTTKRIGSFQLSRTDQF